MLLSKIIPHASFALTDHNIFTILFTEIHLGFGLPSVTVPESVGVLTNILYIEKLNNQESEINITLSVGLSQSLSNLTTSAVPG